MLDDEVENNNFNDDDDTVDPRAHKNLLQAISKLGKVQHIKRATRNESEKQPDEFQLVKQPYTSEEKRAEPSIEVNDIFQLLKKSTKHKEVGRKLRNVASSTKVLPVPLEKPVADRIKRTIGFENVKTKLARWDAVVAKNRTSETQVFPLPSETVFVDISAFSKPLKLAVKSDLVREMEATDAKLEALLRERNGDTRDPRLVELEEQRHLQLKLTRDEMIAQRKELALLRLRESQRSAKARLRNKIKSKKYRNLLKRQKMQEQIKEFELLQKTNPEAALEKLNSLEKNRVLERASLRHKNTGTWAKNLQIRAKYDKDVRKDLSEQLQLSRQLTQKKQDSDEEEDEQEIAAAAAMKAANDQAIKDPFNPWMNAAKKEVTNGETAAEAESYRKYWLERNKQKEQMDKYKELLEEGEAVVKKEAKDIETEKPAPKKSAKKTPNKEKSQQKVAKVKKPVKIEKAAGDKRPAENKTVKKPAKAKHIAKAESPTADKNPVKDEKPAEDKMPAKENRVEDKKPPKKFSKLSNRSKNIARDKRSTKAGSRVQVRTKRKIVNGWIVEKIRDFMKKPNIDEIFDLVEDREQIKLNKKLRTLAYEAKRLSKAPAKREKKLKKKNELQQLEDLTFKEKARRPILDEPLNAEEDKTTTNGAGEPSRLIEAMAKDGDANKKSINGTNEQPDVIDPNKIAPIKLKQFVGNYTGLEAADYDDDGDDAVESNLNDQQLTISQAFVDDDIVADFSKDKTEKSKLPDTEIQLSMPGWGSWAGAGISEERKAAQRNKRLVLKLAPEEKRRDENKSAVFINEEPSKGLRSHLVSDLPFPFTSLQDYEASIRAPIGRNFVPETAFRLLTKPAVITRKGTIIEPMEESELLKRSRGPRNVVERRIAHRMKKDAEAELESKKNAVKEEV